MADTPTVTRLDRPQCLALLGSVPVGRVAVNVGALPAIRTVRFALTGAHVVFRVAKGSTLSRAAAGVVAFQADHYDGVDRHGWCVQVVGRSEEVTDPVEVDDLTGLALEAWGLGGAGDSFFRLPLAKVSGERVRWPAG